MPQLSNIKTKRDALRYIDQMVTSVDCVPRPKLLQWLLDEMSTTRDDERRSMSERRAANAVAQMARRELSRGQ